MPFYIIVLLLVSALFGFLLLLVKFPNLRCYVPVLRAVAEAVSKALEHWKYNNDYAKVFIRLTILSESVKLEGDLAAIKNDVAKLVADAYTYYPDHEDSKYDESRRLAAAGFMLLVSHKELKETIKTIAQSRQSLEVKKATLLAIDVLGELFDLKDELDVDYFQHLIYGINKALYEFKTGTTNSKALSKTSNTLFRLYQITRAYKNQTGLRGLTLEEFTAKLKETFNTLSSAF